MKTKVDTCPKCKGKKEVYQSNYSKGNGITVYKNEPKITCPACEGSGLAEFYWETNKYWKILGRWSYLKPAR